MRLWQTPKSLSDAYLPHLRWNICRKKCELWISDFIRQPSGAIAREMLRRVEKIHTYVLKFCKSCRSRFSYPTANKTWSQTRARTSLLGVLPDVRVGEHRSSLAAGICIITIFMWYNLSWIRIVKSASAVAVTLTLLTWLDWLQNKWRLRTFATFAFCRVNDSDWVENAKSPMLNAGFLTGIESVVALTLLVSRSLDGLLISHWTWLETIHDLTRRFFPFPVYSFVRCLLSVMNLDSRGIAFVVLLVVCRTLAFQFVQSSEFPDIISILFRVSQTGKSCMLHIYSSCRLKLLRLLFCCCCLL